MEKETKIINIIKESYHNIDFIKRYKIVFQKYYFDRKTVDVMTKMNKKENLNIIKELGYKFKIFSPGQDYEYEEEFNNIKLILSCQISGGAVIPYIYIYVDDNKINFRQNLGFVYKILIYDMNVIANALLFRNYDDFREIMAAIIEIYEDFKKEFLKQMEISKLI